MPWVTWYAPLLVTWVGIMINGRFSAFTLGLLFWSTKLAHENKSFSSPPLNVWFRVSVQQITLYRSRTAFWLLIKESIKHIDWWLCVASRKWYTQMFSERRRCNLLFLFTLLFRFENRRARDREPLALAVSKFPAVLFSYAKSTSSKELVAKLPCTFRCLSDALL